MKDLFDTFVTAPTDKILLLFGFVLVMAGIFGVIPKWFDRVPIARGRRLLASAVGFALIVVAVMPFSEGQEPGMAPEGASQEWGDDFSDGTINPGRWNLDECKERPYERDGVLNFAVASPRPSDSFQCLPVIPPADIKEVDIEEVSVRLTLQNADVDDIPGGVGLGATLSDDRYLSVELSVSSDGVGIDIVLCKDDSSVDCDDLANLPKVQKEAAKPVDLKITNNGSLSTIFVNGSVYATRETPSIRKVELHLWADAGSVFHILADNFSMKYRR